MSRRQIRISSRFRPLPSPAVAGHRRLLLALALAAGFGGGPAHAQPSGAQARHGSATLSQQGSRLVVTTQNGAGTAHSAIDWQSFSIPAGTSTHFAQPGAASTSINRVLGPDPSAIFGALSSNGRLVLVNPAGIAVGAGAVVDTAGFTASTLRMGDADAIAGRLRFGDGSAAGPLRVDGQVLARSGDVVLIGSDVQTGAQALVQSPQGATLLAAGRKVELTGRGLEGIVFQVQAPSDQAVNLGTLRGDAVGVFAGTLRHSGLVQADAVSTEGGKVVLKAAGDALVAGTVRASAADGRGGRVDVLGERVGLLAGARVDASGANGGGQVRVGGDYQGANAAVPNARRTFVDAQARIQADALQQGDGGRVIVWSDEATRMHGQISARGGEKGGDGGFAEVSGKQALEFTGLADLRAPQGNIGSLLLDPEDITIVRSAATGSVNTFPQTNPNPPGGAMFEPTAPAAVQLTDTQLNNQLAVSNVLVKTSSSVSTGSGGQITVDDKAVVSWSTGSQLSFEADKGIDVNGRIEGSNSGSALSMLARNGNIVLNSGAYVTAGSMTFQAQGTGGSIDISAVNLLAPGDISLVASGDIRFGGIKLRTAVDGTGVSAGAVSLDAGGNVVGSFIDAAGDYRAGGAAGNAGEVKVRAGGGISVGSISAYGGDSYEFSTTTAPGNGGRGGAVTLDAGGDVAVDSIRAGAGGSYGGSSFAPKAAGAAGSVLVKGKGSVGVDYIDVGGGDGIGGTDAGQVNISADTDVRFTQVRAVGGDSYGAAAAGNGGSVNITAGGDMLLTPYMYADAVGAVGGGGGSGDGGAGGSVSLKAGSGITVAPQAGEVALLDPTASAPSRISAAGGRGGSSAANANGGRGGNGGSIRIESGSPLVIDGALNLFAQGGIGGVGTGVGVGGQGGAGGSIDLRSANAVVMRGPLLSASGGVGGTAGDGVTQAAGGTLGSFGASGTSVEVEADLNLDASWTNQSVVNVRGSSVVKGSGSFRNLGEMHLHDTAQLNAWGGLSNEAGARLASWGSANEVNLAQNAGLLEVGAGSTLSTPYLFSNIGSVRVDGKLAIGMSARSTGQTFTNQSSGTLSGSGEIGVSGGAGTIDNFGTIAPGSTAGSVGILSIVGNLTMQTGSVLSLDLQNALSHDVLDVSGAVRTGGTVQVAYAPGAAFAPGESVAVLRAGTALDGTQVPLVNVPEMASEVSPNALMLRAIAPVPAPTPVSNVQGTLQDLQNQVLAFLEWFAKLQDEGDRPMGRDDIVVTGEACKPA